MAQISISNLNFSYEGSQETVFKDFSCSFDSRWRLGLISRNGRGKTTLLKLIAGELQANSGEIHMPGTTAPLRFPPKLNFNASETAMDLIRTALPNLEDWKLCRELSYLETDPQLLDRSFRSLSPGEQGKLLLAALFAGDDSYVLLDEPGNHLDVQGKQILTRYLAEKRSFLLVSHEREMLNTVTDHTMALLKSGPELVAGPYETWAAHRKNVEQFELAKNHRLEKEIYILQAATRQTQSWAEKAHRESRKDHGGGVKMGQKEYHRAKAAKLERRANQTEHRRDKAAEEKSKLLHDIEESPQIKLSPLPFHRERYIEGEDLCLCFGEKILADHKSFQLRQGERLCLAGSNGAGKSTLLHQLAGINPPKTLRMTGHLSIARGLTISFLPQKSELPDLPLRDFLHKRDLDMTRLLTLLRKMDFPREVFEGSVSQFSSGQKRKLLLAMSLCQEAHLYLWDEPLNYLDIQSREQIEDAILQAKPTMVFVEHDQYFCKKIATKILALP